MFNDRRVSSSEYSTLKQILNFQSKDRILPAKSRLYTGLQVRPNVSNWHQYEMLLKIINEMQANYDQNSKRF